MENTLANNPPMQTGPTVTPAPDTVPQQQNPLQSPTPEMQTVEQTPPPTKKPFPKILIVIIIAVVITATAMLIFKNTAPSTSTKNTARPTRTTPAVAKPQPGLTTYTNKENKFSLQYPQELQVKEKAVGMGVSTVEMRSKDNLNEDYLADIQMMSLPKYLAKAVGQDFDEYYKMADNTTKTISAENQSRDITKVKNRTVNNLRAFEFKSSGESGSTDTIGVYIETGDKIVIISTQQENRENLEKMLSNFTYNP